MKKVIKNVALLGFLSLPCFLVLNEPNPITQEFNWWVNFLGLGYCVWFFRLIKRIFKPMIEIEA